MEANWETLIKLVKNIQLRQYIYIILLEHFEKQIQLCFLLGSQNWKIWRIIFEIDVLERVQLYSPPPSGAILIYCFIINLVLIPELIKTFYIYQLYSILDSKKHLGSACRSPAYRSIYIYMLVIMSHDW